MSSSAQELVRGTELARKQQTALAALRGGSGFPDAAQAAGVIGVQRRAPLFDERLGRLYAEASQTLPETPAGVGAGRRQRQEVVVQSYPGHAMGSEAP